MKAKRANGVTRQAVLEYLVREADMDGLVIVREQDVADSLDCCQKNVSRHIHNLAADGFLTVEPAGSGYKSLNAIQLAEAVFA